MQITSVQTVLIPAGANSVSFTQPSGMSLRAIKFPASFEGTTVSFAAGYTSPGADLYDGSSVYSLTVGADRYVPITKPDLFIGPSFLKIINKVAGSASNVGADRSLELYFAAN